jgi:Zn-dependent peptidase ImmA (M78 family)
MCKRKTGVFMIGEKLKAARVRAGLSLRGLEERIGKKVSAQAIGKYERGDMKPTPRILEVLVEALNVSIEFLTVQHSIQLSKIEFRENFLRSKSDENHIKSIIYDHVSKYLQVEDLLDIVLSDWDKPRQYPFPIRHLTDAEWTAHKIRDDWGLGNDPISNLSEFLEERGFKIIVTELPESVAGVTCFVNTVQGWRIPVIVTNNKITGERQRFTIAHELGHLLQEQKNSELNFEKACDKFASSLLMPDRFLWAALGKTRSSISIGELASLKKFLGVSIQAIVYRCKDLGIINEYTYKLLYREFGRRNWLKPPYDEPNKVELEQPQRFRRLCLRALTENLIDPSTAAHLLDIPEEELHIELNCQSLPETFND